MAHWTPENPTVTVSTPTKKIRILIISDTHAAIPYEEEDVEHAFRWPLPEADVLLHCGDLTGNGKFDEHERTVDMLKKAPAKLKIIIPGNHDISLDREYYPHSWRLHAGARGKQDTDACRALYTSPEAREAGLVYLEEGVQSFDVSGARFSLYASAYTPEFCMWGFAYERTEDRFNPAEEPGATYQPAHPVPDFGLVDIVMTHGPPMNVLDETNRSLHVGCEHLLRAVSRCKPRLHAFGHIHEAWGAKRMDWDSATLTGVHLANKYERGTKGPASVDISSDSAQPLNFGMETLFVNASIMDLQYNPTNAPFVVDLDLPLADS